MDEPAPVAAAHDVLTSPTTDKLLVFRRNGKVITDRLDQDGIPLDNRVYREKEYWDKRFLKEPVYDWLGTMKDFGHLLLPLLNPDSRILIIGCGNSKLSHELSELGYKNVISTDYSEVVIRHQREKHPELQWEVADMFALNECYTSQSFDVVLDKGALDAFLTADEENDPWNSSPEARELTEKMMKDISSLLVSGGHYVHLSFREPHFRLKHFENPEYSWEMHKSVPYGQGYFPYRLYRMTRL